MLLQNLIASSEGLKLQTPDIPITGIDIKGITTDSRNVKPGFLFVAVPGTKEDGSLYIDQAIQQGAVAVLIAEGKISDVKIPVITAPHIRKSVSAIASVFYPGQPEMVAAITGTSGKTSTAQFVREMWKGIGHKSASIGTLGLITDDESRYGSLTTPGAIALHELLDECAGKGITHLALEASSHGIDLNRLDHIHIKVAGFTNLSRDHLDYHETLENYFNAKLRLFTGLMPIGGIAVLNADIPEFIQLEAGAATRGLKVISYGLKGNDIRLMESKPDAKGQHLRLEVFGKEYAVLLPVMGSFQAWNALCALGMVIGSGAATDKAVAALEKVSDVPGRLQLAGISKKGGTVFIDYAHKPDALEKVLLALRPHVAAHQGSKLGVIFGCGGNRDKGKRPIMGEIAQRLADWVIVTDDNPRHEEPALIRQEILAGCKPGPMLQEMGDRHQAIEAGISKLQQGDVLVIAGKGHESGQIVGDQTMPFDDVAVAREVLGL